MGYWQINYSIWLAVCGSDHLLVNARITEGARTWDGLDAWLANSAPKEYTGTVRSLGTPSLRNGLFSSRSLYGEKEKINDNPENVAHILGILFMLIFLPGGERALIGKSWKWTKNGTET